MRRFRPVGTPRVLLAPPPVSLYHREASGFSPLHHDLLGHAPMASLSTSWSDIKATTILAVRKGNRVVSGMAAAFPLDFQGRVLGVLLLPWLHHVHNSHSSLFSPSLLLSRFLLCSLLSLLSLLTPPGGGG